MSGTELSTLKNLKILSISNSPQLEGTIPTEIGMLESLEMLIITNCSSLSGTVPKELANLKNLSNLFMIGTNLSGELATDLNVLNSLQNCSFGGNPTLICKSETLMERNICDVQCQGNTLEGIWRQEPKECEWIFTNAGAGIGTLQIFEDYSFMLETEALIQCSLPMYNRIFGQIKVVNQTQIGKNEYSLDLFFSLEKRELITQSLFLTTLLQSACGYTLDLSKPTDVSTQGCRFPGVDFEIVSLLICPSTQINNVIVDFDQGTMISDLFWSVSLPCQPHQNEALVVTITQGWTCGSPSHSPMECTPTCGDGVRLETEICDDGNLQDKDGCNQDCRIEDGWICSAELYQKNECKPICGDNKAVNFDDCDFAQTKNSNFTSGNGFVGLIVGILLLVLFLVAAGLISRYLKKRTRTFQINEQEIELSQVLGEGKFGKVHKATWRKTTIVAVKVLKSTAMDESNLKEFIEEARLFARLPPHPNIVQFLGITLPPNARIITEYLPNGNLIHWMRSLILDDEHQRTEIYLELARGIVAGMDHLHKNKIIHRDLAARNILIHLSFEKDGSLEARKEKFHVVPKISDFGLSGSVKRNTLVAVRWAAPEILDSGTLKSSTKSDVWAFGVVLYEILVSCQHIPYPGLSNEQVVQAVLLGESLQPPEHSHPLFQQLMKSCLNTSAWLRPSFETLFEALNVDRQLSSQDLKKNFHGDGDATTYVIAENMKPPVADYGLDYQNSESFYQNQGKDKKSDC